MTVEEYKGLSVFQEKTEQSPNNPNTKRVITTYLYVVNDLAFKFQTIKIYGREGIVANKRKYMINSVGVCKREFLTSLAK